MVYPFVEANKAAKCGRKGTFMGTKSSSHASQQQRLLLKNLNQAMKQEAITGAGLNNWEAEELIRVVEEVYFSSGEFKELAPGQVKLSCVSSKEGAGKPLSACQMVSVCLKLYDEEDDRGMTIQSPKQRQQIMRARRMQRICVEAKDQGGLLTQEDLARILMCDVKTIQRDMAWLRKEGLVVPTRGQIKDIGPGVTHRELVIRKWLEGKEPVEVARATQHSLAAVENYLTKFKRVSYLMRKNFTPFEIALTAGISCKAAEVFCELDRTHRHRPFYQQRLEEILIAGQAFYRAEGEKKSSRRLNRSRKSGRKA